MNIKKRIGRRSYCECNDKECWEDLLREWSHNSSLKDEEQCDSSEAGTKALKRSSFSC